MGTSRRTWATPPSQTPTLHLDSYRHSPSRCNTVVTINMYTKAIALAILAVAGVQAQSDYNYEDSDPTPTGAASTGYMRMPSNGTGPYSTGSMAGSGMVAAARRRPTRPSTRVPLAH